MDEPVPVLSFPLDNSELQKCTTPFASSIKEPIHYYDDMWQDLLPTSISVIVRCDNTLQVKSKRQKSRLSYGLGLLVIYQDRSIKWQIVQLINGIELESRLGRVYRI